MAQSARTPEAVRWLEKVFASIAAATLPVAEAVAGGIFQRTQGLADSKW